MCNELFIVICGQGVQLNGYCLCGSNVCDFDGIIIVIGFLFKVKQYVIIYMNIFGNMFIECVDFCCIGFVVLDLVYVVVGCVDGYFEIVLKLWDFVVGELIVCEVGVIVCDFIGGYNYMLMGNIVVGNLCVVKVMLVNMCEQLSDVLKC